MKRARVTSLSVLREIAKWETILHKEGFVTQRVKNLSKPLSSYDQPELLGHALFLMSEARAVLLKDHTLVWQVYGDLCVARSILSFCARIPCGELSPFE